MKILFISLGCDKNRVDSELMLGLIQNKGYEITYNEEEAEVAIINTCCFIDVAKEESIETILEIAEYKKEGILKAIIITGCLAERYKEEILKEMNAEVDAIIGTTGYEEISNVIESVLLGKQIKSFKDINENLNINAKRVLTTSNYSYLKIAEGCDKHCTYCVIPEVRGHYRSVPMERLVKEAEQLAELGIKELILVAQETTLYGKDIYGEKSLHKLLKELCRIEGFQWIRVLYCYPEEVYDELIETMKQEPKVCKYIDMPIQHNSDEILKKMGRRTNEQKINNTITRLRTAIPDIIIRTTLITGFPGETKEDHEGLLRFVELQKFDRLGVFTYSSQEDTKAASMPNQIEEEVKIKRKDELMALQNSIVNQNQQKYIGKCFLVIVEERLSEDDYSINYNQKDKEYVYMGRSYMDIPDVDGLIFIMSHEELILGEFVHVKIQGAEEYDLIGEVVYEYSK